MKTLMHLMMVVAIAALPALAIADDEGSTETEGKMAIGGWYGTVEGSPDMAAEYEPVESSPLLAVKANTHQDWGSLLVAAHYRASNDFQTVLDFDIKRVLRSENTYDKFLHRLGHDPMTNLEATSFNGKVVWHTDLNPNQEYELDYSVLNSRTELQIPSLSALTLAVEYREQKRTGHAQAYSVSHCDNCHMYSRSHPIDEKTQDVALEADVAWKGGFVKATYKTRQLRQGEPYVMNAYDDALHPELQKPVFDNRLQYDSEVGFVPADMWPNQDKDTTRLDLHFDNVGGFVINGGGVWSETENKYTGLKSEYAGYMLNAGRRIGQNGRLRWRGRVYSIDNQDVFVDTIERVTMAGPHAGQTYEDVYGKNFDWTRQSAMNRDVFESKLDYSIRMGKKAGTLRLLWDYESIDREHYEVLAGETQTTENVFGVTWRARPTKGLKLNAHYKHGTIDNPFMLVDGSCSTMVSDRYSNPWAPETPDYDDFQSARIAETTASPADWDDFKAGLAYSSGSMTFSAVYRMWDGSNQAGDLTDWSKNNQTVTATLWSAPSEKVDWYLAYAWQDSEMSSRVCIPVFDG